MPTATLGVVASAKANSNPAVPETVPDLLYWHDADDAASFDYDTAPAIKTWRDKSSGLYHASQTTPANRPNRVLGGLISSRYSVDFNGTTQELVQSPPGTSNTKPFTFFAAVKPTSDATYKGVVGCWGNNGLELRTTNVHRQSLMKQYVAEIGQSTTPLPTTLCSVICVSYSATGQWAAYINGAPDGAGTNDMAYADPQNVTKIGNGLGEPMKGSIGEVIKYSRVLTTAERDAVTGYLLNRWRAGYLDPAAGFSSSADPGLPPTDFTLVAKVIGPSNPTVPGAIAANNTGTGAGSWTFQRYLSGSEPRLRVAYAPEAGGSSTAFCKGPDISGSIDYVAMATSIGGAGSSTYESLDQGQTWSQVAATTSAPASIKDAAVPLTIGRRNDGADIFAGRVFWVEMRSGLDPAGGTVLWRFDANEHTAGTTWTDPRGRVWTLSTAAAIVH